MLDFKELVLSKESFTKIKYAKQANFIDFCIASQDTIGIMFSIFIYFKLDLFIIMVEINNSIR